MPGSPDGYGGALEPRACKPARFIVRVPHHAKKGVQRRQTTTKGWGANNLPMPTANRQPQDRTEARFPNAVLQHAQARTRKSKAASGAFVCRKEAEEELRDPHRWGGACDHGRLSYSGPLF